MNRFLDDNSELLISLPVTDSTNNYLNNLSSKQPLAEFTTVTARFQEAGKGQRGNSWESEAGKNLLFSTLFFPRFINIKDQFILSQIVSLAIKEELERYAKDFSIKWPNDIYWQEQKISGILIENELQGEVWEKSIAGVGININQQEFHSAAPNPVSLAQITGKEHETTALLKSILERIHSYYNNLREGHNELISEKYHASLFRKEGLHLYKDTSGTFKACIKQVQANGNLVLIDQTGKERTYAFKEVAFVLEETV
ncbi:biotin--[acetyl-CoA-carboxylase] ligase [Bacteroides sp. 214]|uniref:biotin--[acetyl-CoA-carboxylase] ligase n=1 Tax=Bacteroides sp. 214 TaxID=2302935 RepID=UPI0013D8A701|nr:biotin--[acetyl-CoA-carboxylase] ligase [Bacteroides sp. 214]NDW12271.1 biotin--[acetyl-CoA-carboxylase] ligase [Bacteroides sp. 214]